MVVEHFSPWEWLQGILDGGDWDSLMLLKYVLVEGNYVAANDMYFLAETSEMLTKVMYFSLWINS